MFDLDVSKMILVGMVALVVVGPKDLPRVLRALGRMLASMRKVESSVRKSVQTLMADADVESMGRHLDEVDETLRNTIARNPATAMRGSLPSAAHAGSTRADEHQAFEFASPEMRAYLAPLPESPESAEPAQGPGRADGDATSIVVAEPRAGAGQP